MICISLKIIFCKCSKINTFSNQKKLDLWCLEKDYLNHRNSKNLRSNSCIRELLTNKWVTGK